MNRTSCLCEHNAKVIATSAYFLCISEQDVETMEMVSVMVTSRTLNTASSCSQLQTIHTDLHSAETMDDTLKGPTWD